MKIKDLLGLSDDMIKNSKLHCAIGEKEKLEPLYAFYRSEFKIWQERQSKRNFEKKFIVSLIYYRKDEWLFVGIYRQLGVEKIEGKFYYRTELLDNSSDFIGRLVIKFPKLFRQSYPHLENCIDDFQLSEIFRQRYTVEPFPGYENVKIKFELLKSIVQQEEKSWKTALTIVKGIYLISDLSNGKLYIGSAYGEKAIWNRWQEYILNGHGGNIILKKMVEDRSDYSNNFQFSILETRSYNAEDDAIIKRESYWKDILLSREFGYNSN